MTFNSGGGTYRISRKADMESFDKLPAEVRAALANAKFNISADSTLRKMAGNYFDWRKPWDTRTAINRVRHLDRKLWKMHASRSCETSSLLLWPSVMPIPDRRVANLSSASAEASGNMAP